MDKIAKQVPAKGFGTTYVMVWYGWTSRNVWVMSCQVTGGVLLNSEGRQVRQKDKSVQVSIVDTRSKSSQVAVLKQEIDRSINI